MVKRERTNTPPLPKFHPSHLNSIKDLKTIILKYDCMLLSQLLCQRIFTDSNALFIRRKVMLKRNNPVRAPILPTNNQGLRYYVFIS